MKIITVVGTRPEIIRLSKIIPKLDKVCDHILVHTGQSFDDNMSGVFFRELGIRKPDYDLDIRGDFAEQFGMIASGIRDVIRITNPDRLLVLGDTNSALSLLIAKRMGVRTYHMEAGNRCYSDSVPEEINRRVVDACSDVLMPYTERSRQNLIREGYESQNIFVTGNPIWEVIKDLEDTDIHTALTGINEYILATAHRQENVDNCQRLNKILNGLGFLHEEYEYPVIFSCHPRTRRNLDLRKVNTGIRIHEPFGLLDFITLEKYADCVLTDSGTVQEECCLFKVPCVTIRDVTERPETIECGSNILSGVEPDSILRSVKVALANEPNWDPPREYLRTDVSDTVVKIVTGY